MVPLIIGIIFFAIGIFFCFRFKWEKINAYLPLVIGTCLILFSTIGPLSKNKAKTSGVMTIKSSEVISVEFLPTERNGIESIFHQNRNVNDEVTIQEICWALNKAKLEDENYIKSYDSACSIRFNLKDKSSFSIGIKKDGSATRVDVNSNGETGWHYAVLEADELGKLIDRLAY